MHMLQPTQHKLLTTDACCALDADTIKEVDVIVFEEKDNVPKFGNALTLSLIPLMLCYVMY
jgi:hypothetical protein